MSPLQFTQADVERLATTRRQRQVILNLTYDWLALHAEVTRLRAALGEARLQLKVSMGGLPSPIIDHIDAALRPEEP